MFRPCCKWPRWRSDLCKAVGEADQARKSPLLTGTVFLLASLTKQVTSLLPEFNASVVIIANNEKAALFTPTRNRDLDTRW